MPGAIGKIEGAEENNLDAEAEPNDDMQRVADWEKGGKIQAAEESFEERAGPIMKAIGSRDDRADIANRQKWKRGAKGREKFAQVSGDRVLSGKTQATGSTSAPFAPEMYEVANTMGALLRIRIVETGNVETVHNENCKPRPHTVAGSDEVAGAKQGDAAALQLHATAD